MADDFDNERISASEAANRVPAVAFFDALLTWSYSSILFVCALIAFNAGSTIVEVGLYAAIGVVLSPPLNPILHRLFAIRLNGWVRGGIAIALVLILNYVQGRIG